jgi:gamma-glutamyltranspeptidase / glutathione hydrolase
MSRHLFNALLLTLAALVLTEPVDAQNQGPRPTTLARRSTVYSPRGMVATSQPLATSAALGVLERGGNAYDAAVVAATVLNVTEPQMTGIGGDVFAIFWDAKEKKLFAMRSGGRSGSLISREELVKRGRTSMPGSGPESVTVPGSLAGWAALLERYGTLSLKDALQPAIRLADGGFPVGQIVSEDWTGQVGKLREDAGARATYLIDGERAPKPGEWFRNPDLANTYRTIAQQGTKAFYGGELGKRLADGLQKLGGFITVEDLAQHQVEWIDPISVDYKDYRLYELPPANQGIAALQMLRMVDGYDLKAMGHNSAQYIHLMTEIKKLAYADLDAHVADPDFMKVTVPQLLSEDYLKQRRAMVDMQHPAQRVEPGKFLTDSETIYLSVADEQGNMVSLINSVYGYFGSGVVIPGLGFILQNRGAGFSFTEGSPNVVAPRKKPFHTIIPAFVTKLTPQGEQPWLSFGVMGGGFQPQGHLQVLLNIIEFGMSLQDAIDAPRFQHSGGLQITLEAPIGDEVRAQLTAMGHQVGNAGRLSYGGAQAVMKLTQGYAGGSDPRKDGHAAGQP